MSLFSLFGELDYLIRAQAWQCREMVAHSARLEQMITMLDDKLSQLEGQVASLKAQDEAEAAEVAQVHTSLTGLIAVANELRQGMTAEQSGRLDAAIAAVADASTSAAAQTAQLVADQSAVDTAAAPPTPAAPPA